MGQQRDQRGDGWRVSGTLKLLATIAVLQIVFLIALQPYLSGERLFSPTANAVNGIFAAADPLGRPLNEFSDRQGTDDYFMQERTFLRFWRDSVKNGVLPFWSEGTLAGASQAHSLIYSWASPVHLPWLLTDDDHLAKALEVLLLLNLGLGAAVWWGRILGLTLPWMIFSAAAVTLMPLAMHYQAHTHQPATYYAGMCVTAALYRYLTLGQRRHLGLFVLWLAYLFLSNFITVTIWTAVACGVVTLAVAIAPDADRIAVLRRLARVGAAAVGGVLATSFFWGPTALLAKSIREPVKVEGRPMAFFADGAHLIDGLSPVGFYNSTQKPFFLVFLALAAAACLVIRDIRRRPALLTALVLGLTIFVVTASPLTQAIAQTVFPILRYTANGLDRLHFFATLFAYCSIGVLAALLAERLPRHAPILVLALAAAFVAAQLVLVSVAAFPDLWAPLASTQKRLRMLFEQVNSRSNPLELMTVGLVIITAFFAMLWSEVRGGRGRLALSAACLLAVGLAVMFRYQGPQMPRALDPATQPIFATLAKADAGRTISLSECDRDPPVYNFEPALAGLGAIDGPVDHGSFPEFRRFIGGINGPGHPAAHTAGSTWICRSAVTGPSGDLTPAAEALFRVLGVRTVFAARTLGNRAPTAQVGGLRAFSLGQSLPDVVFIPDARADEVREALRRLAQGDASAAQVFTDAVALNAQRQSSLHWTVQAPVELHGRPGTLFMNHALTFDGGAAVPGMDLRLAAGWQLCESGGECRSFPWSDVPFRVIEVSLGNSPYDVRYSLSHYRFWLPLSALGAAMVAAMLAVGARGQDRRRLSAR